MARRCHGHNLLAGCPQKVRCFVCRTLSDLGWAFIHLSLWLGRGKFSKAVR